MSHRLIQGLIYVSLWAVCASAQTSEKVEQTAVIVELFTSHGCSSCPPADAVLSELGLQSEWKENIIPLAFHIDYWDEGGWKDPFSHKEWTFRQMRYSRALFTNDYIYTPQVVVQGTRQCLGSDKPKVVAQIRHALRADPSARVRITRDPGEGRRIAIQMETDLLKEIPAKELWGLVALYQNGLETHVEKGENEGKTLRDDFVVRVLYKAFSIDPKNGSHEQKTGVIDIDPAWKFQDGGIAAWVQDPATMRIYGAASVPLMLTETAEVSMKE